MTGECCSVLSRGALIKKLLVTQSENSTDRGGGWGTQRDGCIMAQYLFLYGL